MCTRAPPLSYFLIERTLSSHARAMAEATVHVRELINDLLSETVEEQLTSELAVPLGVSDQCDIATLLHLRLQGRITSGFSLRRTRVEVVQLRCVEQRASGR